MATVVTGVYCVLATPFMSVSDQIEDSDTLSKSSLIVGAAPPPSGALASPASLLPLPLEGEPEVLELLAELARVSLVAAPEVFPDDPVAPDAPTLDEEEPAPRGPDPEELAHENALSAAIVNAPRKRV